MQLTRRNVKRGLSLAIERGDGDTVVKHNRCG